MPNNLWPDITINAFALYHEVTGTYASSLTEDDNVILIYIAKKMLQYD